MKSELLMTRDYSSALIAEKIIRAVQPEIADLPPGTCISMDVTGLSLRIRITSSDPLPSLLRTIDDLLACIQVAEHASTDLK